MARIRQQCGRTRRLACQQRARAQQGGALHQGLGVGAFALGELAQQAVAKAQEFALQRVAGRGGQLGARGELRLQALLVLPLQTQLHQAGKRHGARQRPHPDDERRRFAGVDHIRA